MNESSNKIRTGFILGLSSQIAVDTFFILLLAERYLQTSIVYSNIVVFLSLLGLLIVAPFVLAFIALGNIKGEVPTNGKDRTFRLLTKIFSNVTIVECALTLFAILIVIAIAGTIHIQ